MAEFVSPDTTTVFDDWNRADGAANAGGGSTIWGSTDQDGNASTLAVASHQGKVTAEGGALTVRPDTDLCWTVELSTVGGNYIAFFLHWADTTHWYRLLLLANGNWTMDLNNGSGATHISTASGQSYTSGDALEVRYNATSGVVSLFQRNGSTWNETAILQATDTTLAAGKTALVLGDTSWLVGTISDVSTSAPASGVTIHCDATTGDDSRSRIQASDPATPVATWQRAWSLAQAGVDWHDTVLIEPSDIANPDDPFDTSAYVTANHRIDNESNLAPTLPFGDNSGNESIIVRGHIVNGAKPKSSIVPSARLMKNWRFEDLQFGYDLDSGHNFLTAGVLSRCEDMYFLRCDFTGGGHVGNACRRITFETITAQSPLSPQKLNLDGMGWHWGYLSDDGSHDDGAGLIQYINKCLLKLIRGNDGIQAGMGAFDDPNAKLFIDQAIFWDITEGDEAYHTDALQALGGPNFEIQRSIFLGCSDSFIASDFHNSLITIERNLMVGAGSQIQLQGYDLARIRHNTIIPASSFGRDASLLFYTRQAGTQLQVEIVNNIYGGIHYNDDTASEHHAGSVIDANVNLSAPGASTRFGQNVDGIPEFGTSARLADIPTTSVNFPDGLPANYELANTIANAAIGAGVATDISEDMLGRAYASPPDVGCFQSDAGTPVMPVARPPYVLDLFPADGSIDVAASITPTARLYPVPGETIDPASLSGATAFVTDPTGRALPAVISITAPDANGYQTLSVDLKSSTTPVAVEGNLYALVTYTAHLTTGINDTNGSALQSALSWSFRIVGPNAGAIIPVASPGTATTSASLFGPMRGNPTLEAAALDTLATWLPTYLWETERQHGLKLGTLIQPPAPESYIGGLDFDSYQQDICPMVMVNVNPTENTERTGTRYGQWFEMQIGVPVITEDEHDSRLMAGYYGIAVQGAILQRGSLGGLATRTILVSAPKVEFPDPEDRVLARCVTVFHVFIDGIADEGAGPRSSTPPDSPQYPGTPDAPYNDLPVVTSTPVTLVAERPE